MRTIRELIDDRAPERGGSPAYVIELADACFALEGALSTVFGQPLPADLTERAELRQHALEAARRWVPKLDAQTLEVLRWRIENRGTPIDLAPRIAELDHERMRAHHDALSAHPEQRPGELDRMIDDDPDNDAPYRVLADALLDAGDPRGELIALQLAGKTQLADTLFAEHRERFVGPIATMQPQLTWRRGYIYSAKLAVKDPSDTTERNEVAEMLELITRHPSGRFLVEVAIGIHGVYGYRGDLGAVIDTLARLAPASLRTLHLGDYTFPEDSDISAYQIGDLAALWPRMPRLRRLVVQGTDFSLGDVDLPALESARFQTGGLSAAAARSIADAHWPAMQHLELWFGSTMYGATVTLDDIAPLFERADLTELDSLALRNAELADQFCAALPGEPILATVKRLDLSMGTMTDEGAHHLVAQADALAHLESIVVTDNYLTATGIAALRVFGKRVVVGVQKTADDPDDRFVTVGE